MRCEIEIPHHIVPSDTMKIVTFDENNELISAISNDINIDIEEKKMSFTFCRMGFTFAITQSRTIDIPYKSWSLTSSFHQQSGEDDDLNTSVKKFTLNTDALILKFTSMELIAVSCDHQFLSWIIYFISQCYLPNYLYY